MTEARAFPATSNVTISASEDDTGVTPEWNVEAIAICGQVAGLEVASETELTPGTSEVVTPHCPAGKTPIGAGFTFNLDPNVLFSQMYAFPGQDYSYALAREDEDEALVRGR